MDDPYLLMRQLLHAVDNTSLVPLTLKTCHAVREARQWCRSVEEGASETVLPRLVDERSSTICPKCGWKVLKVEIVGTPAKGVGAPFYVCSHPIRPQENVVDTFTVDVSFVGDRAMHRGNNSGVWVLHDVLCGTPRPEEPRLSAVWDACEKDAIDKRMARERDLQDLTEIEDLLNDV